MNVGNLKPYVSGQFPWKLGQTIREKPTDKVPLPGVWEVVGNRAKKGAMIMKRRVCVWGGFVVWVVFGCVLAAGTAWGGEREDVVAKVSQFIEAISAGDEATVKELGAACCPMMADMPGESLKTMKDYFGEITDVIVEGDKAQATVTVPGIEDSGYVFQLEKADGIWGILSVGGKNEGVFK